MGTKYFAFTFPIRKEDVLESYRSLAEVQHLIDSGVAQNHTLMSASLRNWTVWKIELLASKYGAQNLKFVSEVLTILDNRQMCNAIVDIENILARAKENPEPFLYTLDASHEDHQEDGAALGELYSSATNMRPSLDGRANEGDTAWYLIAYLKSLLAVLREAREHSFYVIHVRHEP